MSGTAHAWRETTLGDICEFKYGKSLPESARAGGDVPVFGSNGEVGRHNEAITSGPTIIIGRKGSFGEVTYSAQSCWPIDTTYYVDASATDADLRWLTYRLSKLGLNQLNRAAAVPGLNREDAYRQRLLVPPLPEQRRIAEILDKADALRAKRRAAIAQLDTLTQSIFLDMFGDPATNPKGWPVVGVEDVCTLIVDCVNRTAPTVQDPTPYKMIRTSNVKSGNVDLTEVRFVTRETFDRWNRRATPQRGDVLLTREAPVGETGIIDSDDLVFLGQRLMLYRANHTRVTPEYLLESFRGSFLQKQFGRHGSGSTVKHLPLPACRAFEIQAPPIELQRHFSRAVEVLKSQKRMQAGAATELNSLFASLQHRAFTRGI